MLQQPISINLLICYLSLLPGHKSVSTLPVPFIFNPLFIDKANRDLGNEVLFILLVCLVGFLPVFVLILSV